MTFIVRNKKKTLFMPLRHCWVYPVQSPDFLGEEIVVQRGDPKVFIKLL